VYKAAQEARRQVLEVAAEELEANIDDLEIVDGQVQVKGVPDKGISLKQIAATTTAFGGHYEPIFGRGRVAPPVSAPGFVAHLARVHVDQETGVVRVLDYVAVQDVGRAINPAGIEGQVRGGVAQGIGWALLERIVYDENGQLRTGTLMDYALPNSVQVPPIDVIALEVPSPEGPLGARGVGEPPIVPGAAVIANAILDATGVRPTDVPITAERLLSALRNR
jgi:CO/xanthine dehydrogenase Mo-binding subunit